MKKDVFVASFSLLSLLLLTSCAQQVVHPEPTDGSRADGTVTLSWEMNYLTPYQVDKAYESSRAASVCRSWGYRTASPTFGSQQRCAFASDGQCYRFRVDTKYQCE